LESPDHEVFDLALWMTVDDSRDGFGEARENSVRMINATDPAVKTYRVFTCRFLIGALRPLQRHGMMFARPETGEESTGRRDGDGHFEKVGR
jgi:hypothetical protein